MAVVEGLRRARLRAGLPLRTVAQRSGIAETNLSTIEHARRDPTATTVDRFAEALGVRLIPVATGGRGTAADASDAIAAYSTGGDDSRAYRVAVQLADDLAGADPFIRALLVAEPAATGDPGWDGLIAAIVEWRLAEVGLPTPDWVADTRGTPQESWSPPGAVLAARPERVLEPFARRGIQVEADEFAST